MRPARASERGSLEHFRALQRLHDHWARPPAPRSYCWFLTFENCPAIADLTRECQEAIAFSYYDLVAVPDLHLTLGQVGVEGCLTPGQRDDLRVAASRACAQVALLRFTVGALGGTAGAIGFSVYPREPVLRLRDSLRKATTATFAEAPGNWPDAQPHVSIAYANADVSASAAIATVEKLHGYRTVVTIRDVALVLLERGAHAYTWQTIYRVPLGDGLCRTATTEELA